jgi:NodT family efflux transporter outer membrane factor (OMF) lipoprotein
MWKHDQLDERFRFFRLRISSKSCLDMAAAAAAALLFAGCTVGPNFLRPRAPAEDSYGSAGQSVKTAGADVAGGAAQRIVKGLDLPAQWWTLFRSPALNRLVESSLNKNPDLRAAEAALRQAMENVYAQRGFYFPTIQVNGGPSRQRNAIGTLAPNLSSGDAVYNLYTAQLAISYVPDVFGLNRRQVESLQALAEVQRFQVEAAYLSLTSNVVSAAIQEALLRAQLEATEVITTVQREQLRISQVQFDAGQIAKAEVVAQEALYAQTLATVPVLKKQLAQQRNLLTALAGGLPNEEPAEQFNLAALELPEELPLSLPSRLVEQRPDVRAAEAQLHAASAQIGVAIGNMLPQTTITAAKGGVATELGQMFQAGNIFWSLGANIAQTLFAGGTLIHRKRGAEAAFDQAAAQYKSTVITAFRNVADTLRALEFDAEVLQAQVTAERAAAKSLEYVQRGRQLGAVSYLAVLSAQQAYQQAVLNLVLARASRYEDTVALFQALGGGWWNRTDGSRPGVIAR